MHTLFLAKVISSWRPLVLLDLLLSANLIRCTICASPTCAWDTCEVLLIERSLVPPLVPSFLLSFLVFPHKLHWNSSSLMSPMWFTSPNFLYEIRGLLLCSGSPAATHLDGDLFGVVRSGIPSIPNLRRLLFIRTDSGVVCSCWGVLLVGDVLFSCVSSLGISRVAFRCFRHPVP